MTTSLPTAPVDLERKIDQLSAQVAFLAEEAKLSRQRRQRWDELQHDMMPIATDAMTAVGRELEDIDFNVADLTSLLKRLVQVAPLLDRALGQVEMYAELAHTVVPISGDALEMATARLADAEHRGYFAFAKGAARVADRVVTGFSEDDVEQLGDNVVLILNTIKDLTQPEVMTALNRMISAVQAQQRRVSAEPTKPPGLFHIMLQLRDPEIRRGMARGLEALRAVSEPEGAPKVNPINVPTGGN